MDLVEQKHMREKGKKQQHIQCTEQKERKCNFFLIIFIILFLNWNV